CLRPNWFVNVNSREFQFVAVNWERRAVREEVAALKSRRISAWYPVLETAYRNLAENAETNHRYEEASAFRYMAMESRRLEHWHGLVPWRLSWWYWLASWLWGTSSEGVSGSLSHLVCRGLALHSRRLRTMGAKAGERS